MEDNLYGHPIYILQRTNVQLQETPNSIDFQSGKPQTL